MYVCMSVIIMARMKPSHVKKSNMDNAAIMILTNFNPLLKEKESVISSTDLFEGFAEEFIALFLQCFRTKLNILIWPAIPRVLFENLLLNILGFPIFVTNKESSENDQKRKQFWVGKM